MALSRLVSRHLHQVRLLSCPSSSAGVGGWTDAKRFMSTEGTDKVAGETSDGKEVATCTHELSKQSKSSLFPRTHRNRGLWRSRNHRDYFVPSLFELFPSGLGNALIQASESMNRLLEDLNVSPWSLSARVRDENGSYKLRFDVPGLRKEDLKISVDDGVLIIDGERNDIGSGSSESDSDEDKAARVYGYYHTKLVLPKDAKADEINATLKNGVLCVTIPKAEKPKKEIKEIQIQ